MQKVTRQGQITIKKTLLDSAGLAVGDYIDLSYDPLLKKIVITPLDVTIKPKEQPHDN